MKAWFLMFIVMIALSLFPDAIAQAEKQLPDGANGGQSTNEDWR